MHDLRIPVVGTALTKPERRIIEKTGVPVTSFRIVVNYRRYDRATAQWVDHGLFRIRVSCWRRLADHVFKSVDVGDPVMVIGRIFTREWQSEQGELRVNYEMEADTVGHDLSRGITNFTRMRIEGPQSVVEDEEAESRIGGELTYPADAAGMPLPHDALPHDPYDSAVAAEAAADALAMLREAGMTGPEPGTEEPSTDDEDGDDLVGAGAARRRRGR
jgi:single-strand DNA-binding protein